MTKVDKKFIVQLQGRDISPLREINPNHNHFKHGLTGHPIYNIWKSMRQRCNNPNNKDYETYGGRGIKVCNDWDDARNFFQWAISNGYKTGLTIDRINNDLDYSPDNCRWVGMQRQNSNRRDNNKITHHGKTMTLSEWSRELGLSRTTLFRRQQKGWPIEGILSTRDWRFKE